MGNDIGGHANRKIKEVWTRTRLQWQGAIQVAGGRHVGDLQVNQIRCPAALWRRTLTFFFWGGSLQRRLVSGRAR